jgi:isoquinoline 1-oxidoreductase beta subunit
MGRRFSRRAFLIGSTAIAGGVVFGGYAVARDAANPLKQGLGLNAATFNPWVKISPEKITLITPHADVGQGVASAQAILIAEEMDLELGQFETEFGPPSAAYYNAALADGLVPFRVTDNSFAAKFARKTAAAVLKASGQDLTGGSSSVADSYTKLRVAGAVARETLKATAARRSGLPVTALHTEAGAVILPDGKRIAYTDLAAEAAKIDPVTDVTLRKPSQWRLIGKPTQRLDIEAKATGALKFGIDQAVEGMVFATVKLNPHKGAALQSFDASRAEGMPGVKKILKITNGIAVVASNTWYAMKAADAVECQWAAAAYPPDQAEHWAAVEASFTPHNVDKVWRNDGNVDAVLPGAKVVEAKYRAPYVAHQPLEPLNAIAVVRDDGAEIWAGHQIPRAVHSMTARMTKHPPERVVFHNQWSGGSFGHRLEFENIRCAVEIANQMRGTPVKLVFSREEDFLQDFPRQIGMAHNRGAVSNGRIVAADFRVSTVSAVRSQSGRMGRFLGLVSDIAADVQIPQGVWNMTYAIPNFRTTTYTAAGLSPCSSWRSVGASTGGFFGECFIDELIHAAGLDPLQARIDMCSVDYHRKVLEEVGKMSSWSGPLGNGKGRGVAFVESFGVPVAEVIEVSATDKGIRIDKVWVAADVGRVVDPVNFENLVQGGVVWGLGHAMNCELTYADGAVQQRNFNSHEGMRLYQCPTIEVRGLENGPELRGIGEPPVPPAAPALANAIFAATGKRIREMPFNKFIAFV